MFKFGRTWPDCCRRCRGESHVKLLRLLATNSAGNVAFAADLLALYTPLKIVLCLDNICNEKENTKKLVFFNIPDLFISNQPNKIMFIKNIVLETLLNSRKCARAYFSNRNPLEAKWGNTEQKNQPHISTTDAQNSTFPPLSHSRCYFVVLFSLFVKLQTQNAIKTRAAENVKRMKNKRKKRFFIELQNSSVKR